MTWQTHSTVGANSVWIASLFYPIEYIWILFLFIGAFAALMPDADADRAKIHSISFGLSWAFKPFKHRSFLHSIPAALILFVLCYFTIGKWHPALPLIVTLGYFSHPLIDGLNGPGVRYFFPLPHYVGLLPRPFRVKSGGIVDGMIFFLAISGITLFIYTNLEIFSPNNALIHLLWGV